MLRVDAVTRRDDGGGPAMRWAALLLSATIVAACAGSAPPRRRRRSRSRPRSASSSPGPLALTPDGGLVVGDRRLRRVVRVDLRTRARRVVARLPDVPVGLAFDDTGRLYVSAGERIFRSNAGGSSRSPERAPAATRVTAAPRPPPRSPAQAGSRSTTTSASSSPSTTTGSAPSSRRHDRDGCGNGATGYAGDGGPATAAVLAHPHDIALRRDRQVVIADSHNGVLRLVDPNGVIRTLTTGLVSPIVVEGGRGDALRRRRAARSSAFRRGRAGTRVAAARGAFGLAVDSNNTVYFAELDTRRVRETASGRRNCPCVEMTRSAASAASRPDPAGRRRG